MQKELQIMLTIKAIVPQKLHPLWSTRIIILNHKYVGGWKPSTRTNTDGGAVRAKYNLTLTD